MGKQKRYNGYLRKSFTFNGKRIYVYGITAAELAQNEVTKRAELENGQLERLNPTLNSYYDHFTSIRRNEVRESTLRAQACQYGVMSAVEIANGLTLGNVRIQDITRKDIETAREILLKSGKTPQNLNICFAHLNHVFQCAVVDETISKNPCKALKQLKRETPPVNETKHRALTEDETQRFFAAAAERNSFYTNCFMLMISSGMRIGEIAALKRSDIDYKNGFIHIRKTITRNEAGGYEIGDNTKTTSGQRDIPLTDVMKNVIKSQEGLNRLIFNIEFDGTLFKSSEGEILREYTANREIKRICKAAGIEEFTCHAFRNTFATRFIEQRPQDYKILSEILGHKDISITLNLYTHVMTENKVKAMKELSIKIG